MDLCSSAPFVLAAGVVGLACSSSSQSHMESAAPLHEIAPARDLAHGFGSISADARPEGSTTTVTDGQLLWIENDYSTAIARARSLQVPVVIDFWAEWCHTCLSMKHTTLVDPGLRDLAERFVWLAIDTEQPGNAAVVRDFPPLSWPTFHVIDPFAETSLARLSGGAAVRQFREFVLDAESAFVAARADGGQLDPAHPLARLRTADAQARADRHVQAIAHYDAVLAQTSPRWSRRVDVMVLRLRSLIKLQRWESCASWADDHLQLAGDNSTTTEYLYWMSRCTKQLGAEHPIAPKLTRAALDYIERLMADARAPLSADDRSELLKSQREFHEQRGQFEAARASARAQKQLLDVAAAAAPSALAASTFNWPRAEVYVYLGLGEQLLPVLEASVEALPGHYDPPYRLAWVLHQLGRPAEALTHAQTARTLVEGPRRARVDALIADIQTSLAAPKSSW